MEHRDNDPPIIVWHGVDSMEEMNPGWSPFVVLRCSLKLWLDEAPITNLRQQRPAKYKLRPGFNEKKAKKKELIVM
jgi:hypothetical protein